MAKPPTLCPSCLRQDGDLHPISSSSDIREVSLTTIQSAAEECTLCFFVQYLLQKDETTPKTGESEYESARVRVEDGGLKFTGQWQGALVMEIYRAGEFALLSSFKLSTLV